MKNKKHINKNKKHIRGPWADVLRQEKESAEHQKRMENCIFCGGSGREYETIGDDTPCHVCSPV